MKPLLLSILAVTLLSFHGRARVAHEMIQVDHSAAVHRPAGTTMEGGIMTTVTYP